MSQISLTASMRSNLLSLQNTASLMNTTQERLASGKKVNSAIDNPSSFYTAQSLNNRASDLSGLLDSMGQAISTIKAADEGIEAITSFVEQAKAVATSALDTTDLEAREKYVEQFNDILTEIDHLAKDSGYKGINLLQGDTLTVTFNETRDNKLDIVGVDASTGVDGLDIAAAADWGTSADVRTKETALATAETAVTTAKNEYNTYKDANSVDVSHAATAQSTETSGKIFKLSVKVNEGDVISFGDNFYVAKSTLDGSSTPVEVTSDQVTELGQASGDKLYYATDKITDANTKFAAIATAEGGVVTAKEELEEAKTAAISSGAENINKALTATANAINKLRNYSSDFGNSYSIVQTREDFTTNLINVLEEGADKLTLADMNEESANMLALQTRQQLAINSLSLAAQAAQSVLKLF